MSNHYSLHVPVEGTDNKKRYPRVGVMFENVKESTGETYFTLRLDYPVAVTELLAFTPKSSDGQGNGGAE